jgi:hypothetical protein
MKHVWNTIGIILAASLIVGLAADGNARSDARSKDKSIALMMADSGRGVFSVTAQYLGTLEDEIYIGGKRVNIPASTPVYVVGRGIQDGGYFANNQTVYISGVHRSGMAIAKMIVVRPDEAHTSGASSQVGEYADDVPN